MRLGIAFGDDRRVESAQQADGIADRRVDQDQRVGFRQAAQLLPADGQLARPLAVGRCPSRRRPGRSSAWRRRRCVRTARPAHGSLTAQEVDAGLHVERDLLPEHRRLVVVEARVHRQHEEPAPCELAGGEVSEVVVDAMDQQDADVGWSAGVGPIERALDRERIELEIESDGSAPTRPWQRGIRDESDECRLTSAAASVIYPAAAP